MEMSLAHWLYLAGTMIIILTMLFRQNVVMPAVLFTFFVAWAYRGDLVAGLQAIFNAILTAAGELFNIFLIIALMTALLQALKRLRADERMIRPFEKIMVNGHLSFWILAVVTYFISLFFWPTPAVPLVAAILIPAALRAGLPAMGAAIAVSLAGQGMALSSDYVIQIAPHLSASSAGVNISEVADKSLVLSLITGGVALLFAYLLNRKKIVKPGQINMQQWESLTSASDNSFSSSPSVGTNKEGWSKAFAILVPVVLLSVVAYMILAKFSPDIPSIEGGNGAALIGGSATLLLILACLSANWKQALQQISEDMVEGLLFAFRAMGPVLPIAGFFFIGNGDYASRILSLPEGASVPSFLFDLVQMGHTFIPENPFFGAFGLLIVGMLTGLDGSGFSGLPLTGALSGALGQSLGMDPTTLAAIGQMGAIWVGGGTLIAWSSLVAVAGFTRVPVLDLVRKNFLPVIAGLVLSTLFAILFY
jgi:hypothetical protein